jgi:hypothetical protein
MQYTQYLPRDTYILVPIYIRHPFITETNPIGKPKSWKSKKNINNANASLIIYDTTINPRLIFREICLPISS